MKNQVHLTFLHSKKRENSQGKSPIYARIRVAGKRTDFSTGYFVKDSEWDSFKGRVKERCPDARIINAYLNKLVADADKQQMESDLKETKLNGEVVRNKFLGVSVKQKTILGVMTYHNDNFKKMLGQSGYAKGTYNNYLSLEKKLIRFIKKDYLRSDLNLIEVNYEFVSNFEIFLLSIEKLKHNSAMMGMSKLRKIINLSMANEWIEKNPFIKYKLSLQRAEPRFLTPAERDKIANFKFKQQHLQVTADKFIFCCYTGLSYSDMNELKESHIVRNIDGGLWIEKSRVKTDAPFKSFLYPKAESIYKKYRGNHDTIFPPMSCENYNRMLKKVATACGIEKAISTHNARHTFGFYYISMGGSIYALKNILGHRSIKNTEIYSSVNYTLLSVESKAIMQKERVNKKKNISLTN